MTARPEFDLFVDEFGSVGSDVGEDPYGFGFFIAERGAAAEQLADKLLKAVPSGSHFKNIRKPRKAAHARRLLDLLPSHGHFYGGAHVVIDPAYARNYAADFVAQQAESLSPEQAEALSSTLRGLSRLTAVYQHAVRLPLFGLLKAPGCPRRLKVRVHVGVVGEKQSHSWKLGMISGALSETTDRAYCSFLAIGAVPSADVEVTLGATGRGPLFDMADLFAGIAWNVAKKSDIAAQLVEVARDRLLRLPTTNLTDEFLGPGIVIVRDRVSEQGKAVL